MGNSSITILFDSPFWVGLYERSDGDTYEVCRIVFGAEPKDGEVYEYLLRQWRFLPFSPPVKGGTQRKKAENPKRMQREIRKSLQSRSIGTKAQQALKLQQEQRKTQRREAGRTKREAEQERQYQLRREKAREKHKGH